MNRTTCPTCGKSAEHPHRRIVGGVYVEGCVDAFHTGHLISPSDSANWHHSKTAKVIRKAAKAA